MRNIILFSLLALAIIGCNGTNHKSRSPFLKYAANKDGLIEGYKYNTNKPKVVTYVKGLKFFKGQLDYTFKREGIQNFIDSNSDFEFVFYARIDETQIDSALLMLKQFDISQVYYFDTEDICIDILDSPIHTSVIFDKDDKKCGGGVMSKAFIGQIEKYMNLLREEISGDAYDNH